MNEALKTLETEFSENEKRISNIESEIASLMQQAEIIKKNNEHLSYSIALIEKQSGKPTSIRINRVSKPVEIKDEVSGKVTLRSALRDILNEGNPVGVSYAWEKVTALGIKTTRASVNSSLHNLVKKGDLVQPDVGLYQKAS